MRSATYVVGLAFRRLRRRNGGALGAALGIAAAAAVLAGILVGATVAKDRSVAQDVERLPAATRAVRASWFGVPAGRDESWRVLDGQARAALAQLPAGEPVPIVLVREATLGGAFVGLAAVDGLAPHVLLRSGRLPRACTPERCEVLRLRGAGRLPDVPGLRIVQVGTASLRSRQLFGDFLAPTDNALEDAELAPALARSDRYHRPAPGPLVVAEGVAGLVSSPVLARAYRSYGWVQRLLRRHTAALGDRPRSSTMPTGRGPSCRRARPRGRSPCRRRSSAPPSTTRRSRAGGCSSWEARRLRCSSHSRSSPRGALRRDLASARRRLTWHGARRWQRVLLTATESVAIGLGGAAVGWVIGSAGGAVAASLAGAPVGAVLRESVLSPGGLLLGLAVALLAALVIAVTVSLEIRGRGRIGPLEIAAAAAVVAVLAVLASGSVDAGELAAGGAAPAVLLLLPGLVAFAAAVVASRFLPGAGRLFARRGARDVRLAGVSVARSPGAAGVAAAFLALAVGLAVLAVAYRSTLQTGERDQAAYAVPADVVVREDLRALVPVTRAAPLSRYGAIPGVEAAYPVLRSSASAGPAASVSGVTVLGVPGPAIRAMPLWRGDWGTSKDGPCRGGCAERVDRAPGRHARRGDDAARRRPRPRVVPRDDRTARRLVPARGARPCERRPPQRPLRGAARGGARRPARRRSTLVPPRIIERGSDEGVALRGTTTVRLLDASLAGWLGDGGVTVSGDGRRAGIAPGRVRLDPAAGRTRASPAAGGRRAAPRRRDARARPARRRGRTGPPAPHRR